MKTITTIIIITAIAIGIFAKPAPTLRTWTDKNGRQIQATLIKADQDSVQLQLPNNRQCTIPLSRLSPQDQNYTKAKTTIPPAEEEPISPPPFKDTLGFKGLQLQMTQLDIDTLTNNSPWEAQNATFKQNLIFLQAKTSADLDFQRIGSSGTEETRRYYAWADATANLHKGKIYQITINSRAYTADYIDINTKEWLKIIHHGLCEKYGQPARTMHEIKDINILTFKNGYYIYTTVWQTPDGEIRLGIHENDSKYGAIITFIDPIAEQEIKSATTIKTTL
ncbi:MAG: SHD1 domain-containing protein [Kiritimatiellae bacterium]|nr:SHD1 domain-containing protein [Kiritimatiellia bacterium]